MLYLSKLTLRIEHPVVVRAIGDLHALHRLILQGYPDAADGGMGRVLFRLELPRRPSETPALIIQSDKSPDWTPLETLACIEGPKEWSPTFAAGQKLRFRLRATPTKKTNFGDDATKPGHRRIGLFTEEEQRKWLDRKASESGFEALTVDLRKIGWQSGRQPGGMVIRHHAIEYDGILQIIDSDAFTAAVIGGIGPAKGFGFGLLSLSRG
jgi:CRISPR system Cascade subunit CasE